MSTQEYKSVQSFFHLQTVNIDFLEGRVNRSPYGQQRPPVRLLRDVIELNRLGFVTSNVTEDRLVGYLQRSQLPYLQEYAREPPFEVKIDIKECRRPRQNSTHIPNMMSEFVEFDNIEKILTTRTVRVELEHRFATLWMVKFFKQLNKQKRK